MISKVRTMDKLDKNLLAILQSEGYQTSAILAPRLGVAERTVRRRISMMKRKGIIRIIAVPNPILSGYRTWTKIGIKVNPGCLSEVAQQLVEHPSIYFVAYSLGTFDIMIAVHFDSMERLTHFINTDLAKIEGISGTEAMMLVWPRRYYNFYWPEPAPGKNNEWEHLHSNYAGYEIDDIDRRIIDILMEDGLTPVRVLKTRLNICEGTIRKRIRQMLRSGVFKIETVPNPELLEYEVWATMGITTSHQLTHQVINAIMKNSAVYLASVSLGRFNIVISARFPNIDLLNEFVHMKLPEIKGIGAIETFLHTRPLKYHNTKWFRRPVS